MNLYHPQNLQEAIDGMKKIFSISWAKNFKKIAVAHVDDKRNVRITLFDEEGERKDSFPTRPANKNNKSYVVRDIAFSSDSSRIAVSQSDSIVFVYNIGINWGDKKISVINSSKQVKFAAYFGLTINLTKFTSELVKVKSKSETSNPTLLKFFTLLKAT